MDGERFCFILLYSNDEIRELRFPFNMILPFCNSVVETCTYTMDDDMMILNCFGIASEVPVDVLLA